MSDVFHLGLTRHDLGGATLAIVPGDPGRVQRIAELGEDPMPLASTREYTSWRTTLAGTAAVVCSTGIGGPSTSIAVEELAQLVFSHTPLAFILRDTFSGRIGLFGS